MKKILIFFFILLINNSNFAKERSILESNIKDTEDIVQQEPKKTKLDVKSIYDSLNIKDKIDYSVFQKAYLGYIQILDKNPGILIIVDYTKPSNEERFFVLDLINKKLVYSVRVAHSKNSGLEIPLQFSDDPNSYQSSLGFFLTLKEYNGAYGYSLRLKGLEENINSNAEDRAIVIHGGNIVEDEYIKKFGFAGRSLGCFVLPQYLTKKIIDFIKHKRVLFVNGNDEEYVENSLYLSKLTPLFEEEQKNIIEAEKTFKLEEKIAKKSKEINLSENKDVKVEKRIVCPKILQEVDMDNLSETKPKENDTLNQQKKSMENKKRKYSEELIKKSLGLGVKLGL